MSFRSLVPKLTDKAFNKIAGDIPLSATFKKLVHKGFTNTDDYLVQETGFADYTISKVLVKNVLRRNETTQDNRIQDLDEPVEIFFNAADLPTGVAIETKDQFKVLGKTYTVINVRYGDPVQATYKILCEEV